MWIECVHLGRRLCHQSIRWAVSLLFFLHFIDHWHCSATMERSRRLWSYPNITRNNPFLRRSGKRWSLEKLVELDEQNIMAHSSNPLVRKTKRLLLDSQMLLNRRWSFILPMHLYLSLLALNLASSLIHSCQSSQMAEQVALRLKSLLPKTA